ncbi:MAG: PD-(D/E)XK nuclease family protein [Chloroflexi bacterium]|nr:PD-(D/E)XK nuclease family protein [Chloroflexota bacterium]
MYQSCPLSYRLRYIDRLEAKEKWYFSFGKTIHLCAEHFFRVKVPPPSTLEELLQFYEQEWLAEGFESAEEEMKYKAYGREILSKFWEIHYPEFRPPLAVERLFYIDVDGIKLRGFIDRVDKLESGGLSIVDYKTNRDLFTIDHLEQDLQLTLYQMATEQLWQLPVEKLTLYHMRSNTPCSCGPRDSQRLEQARHLILEVAENIARGKFPATEHQYCPCDFPEHCPYYRHQYLVAAGDTVGQPELPGIAIADSVEQYVSLQQQIKELRPQLEEAKQAIIGFCEAEGLNRVQGKDNSVTYKLVEMTGFSEDEVRELLAPAGLWEQVLSLDQSKLKELLGDEATAQDIRKRLESLRKVVSTSARLWVKKLEDEP